MRGVNRVTLLGNLGADPEVRYTPSGKAVANLRLATSESYRDQNGDTITKTEWHSLVAWEKTAEILGEFAKKGNRLYVEGKLQTRQWEDQEGNTRYSTEVVVREFSLETPKSDNEGSVRAGKPENTDASGRAPAMKRPARSKAAATTEPADEDLPI